MIIDTLRLLPECGRAAERRRDPKLEVVKREPELNTVFIHFRSLSGSVFQLQEHVECFRSVQTSERCETCCKTAF